MKRPRWRGPARCWRVAGRDVPGGPAVITMPMHLRNLDAPSAWPSGHAYPCGECAALVPATGCPHWRPLTPQADRSRRYRERNAAQVNQRQRDRRKEERDSARQALAQGPGAPITEEQRAHIRRRELQNARSRAYKARKRAELRTEAEETE